VTDEGSKVKSMERYGQINMYWPAYTYLFHLKTSNFRINKVIEIW
jgi:hypothetical protein